MGDWRFNQVFQHRQMREQVEVLEHVADVNPLLEDLFLFEFKQLIALTAIADVVPVNLDKAFIHAFEVIDGP
ncbi:hypothetical protein D3C75_1129490 [compost metagenome]